MRSFHPVPKSASRPAFTLIEVVIAMTLIALLSGMVFGIVGLSMQAASSMQQSQMENDSVNRLIALCRQTFQSLPGTAILTLKITEPGTPALQEITISGAPETFPFGTRPLSYKDSILGLRPGTDSGHVSELNKPLFTLGLSREDLVPVDPNQGPGLSSSATGLAAPDDQGRTWMPLLPDVVSLNWRCYKKADDTWEEEWSGTDLPQLVEMTLLLDGRTQPIRVIYALPVVKLAGANKDLAPKPAPATAAQPAAAGGNNNPAGGQQRPQGTDGGRGAPAGDGKGKSNNGGGRGGQDGGRGGAPQPGGGGASAPQQPQQQPSGFRAPAPAAGGGGGPR
jgi:prepilin-type N-terminal cleavage/methylation domain-containing protein